MTAAQLEVALLTAPPLPVPFTIRERERLLWWFRHPFAEDLEAVVSTNS